MKKHVFGLLIFGFIVSAAVVSYAVLNVSDVKEVFVVTNSETYPEVKSCWRMNKQSKDSNNNSVKINQAVFNLQSKEFSWELATPETNAPIALHFFSKDGKETHYITTDSISGSIARNGLLRFNTTYQWMTKCKTLDNLYVTADFNLQYGHYGNNFQPEFDAANATAVTVNHGDLNYPIVGNVEIK